MKDEQVRCVACNKALSAIELFDDEDYCGYCKAKYTDINGTKPVADDKDLLDNNPQLNNENSVANLYTTSHRKPSNK